jgi:hypothetical protein
MRAWRPLARGYVAAVAQETKKLRGCTSNFAALKGKTETARRAIINGCARAEAEMPLKQILSLVSRIHVR